MPTLATEVDMPSSDHIKAIIYQAKEYWVHSDIDRFVDLFTPDGEFVREGHRWQGHKAIHDVFSRLLNQLAIKQIEIQRVLVEGNGAVMEWTWETVDKESGDRRQKQEAIAIDFVGDFIQSWREHTASEQPIERTITAQGQGDFATQDSEGVSAPCVLCASAPQGHTTHVEQSRVLSPTTLRIRNKITCNC